MSTKVKLLFAEDEPALGKIVKESLESRNYEVTWVLDGETAISNFQAERPDLIIMDVMLPKKDGYQVVQEIRTYDLVLPIIFLTAKSQAQDVVRGFRIGGNDYLKKPFSIEELVVRVENLLGKTVKEQHLIRLGRYLFDSQKQLLQFEGEPAISLTYRETRILHFLSSSSNEIIERSIILNSLWGDDDFFSARSMDVFISKLRKKLKKDPSLKILNIRGIGFKLIT